MQVVEVEPLKEEEPQEQHRQEAAVMQGRLAQIQAQVRLEQSIQEVVEAAVLLVLLGLFPAAPAAPVSSLSSIKHHHKRYLRLKDLVSGLFQPV